MLPVQVLPLRRQLKTLKAWITGQRKDQSPGTRMEVPVVQVDPAFEGVTGGAGSLIKYNPLSNITSAEVWNFLRIQVSAGGCTECSSKLGRRPCKQVWEGGARGAKKYDNCLQNRLG